MTNEQALRLECLRLALDSAKTTDAGYILDSANQFYRFLVSDCLQLENNQDTAQAASDDSFQIPQAVSFRVSGLEGQALRVLLSQLLK